jgi:cytochrome P450
MRSAVPPRAPGLPFVGSVLTYWRDPLGFMVRTARDLGDVAIIPIAGNEFWLFSHPAQIEQILVTEARHFMKDRTTRELSRVVGNGLLTSEGDFWRRQRRLAQPAFHRDRIASYAASMVEETERAIAGWRAGEERDLHAELMRLTLAIVAKTLFGADMSADAKVIGDSIAILSDRFTEMLPILVPIINDLPTPGSLRVKRAIGRLDEIIIRMIRQHRSTGAERGDLLDMLLAARDEDGSRMTDQQVRDEVMTLLLAGHETTAIALTWTFYLLARHPAVEETLLTEVAGALAGRAPQFADLPRLRYAEHVVTEAMRLYPPAWAVGREALDEVTIGGWRVPKGAQIWMSSWSVHRDARFFDEPERFRPERWTDDLMKRLPRHAYFPFGGGPRICIGNSFAMMEATLLLATIVQRFQLKARGAPTPVPSVTLRPAGGYPVKFVERRIVRMS